MLRYSFRLESLHARHLIFEMTTLYPNPVIRKKLASLDPGCLCLLICEGTNEVINKIYVTGLLVRIREQFV